MLHDDNFQALHITRGRKVEVFINNELKNIAIPKGCLVTLLQRDGEILVPNGGTKILEGDRLTIVGDPISMKELRKVYNE